jgi:hypothetical protein
MGCWECDKCEDLYVDDKQHNPNYCFSCQWDCGIV